MSQDGRYKLCPLNRFPGMKFFSYLTRFQLFSSENKIQKVAGHGQNRSEMKGLQEV